MSKALQPGGNELRQRVDEVLHYLWDPIGVCKEPWARDEYRAYVPQVLALVRSQSSEEEIAKYLTRIETEQMRLTAESERALDVARVLLAYRNKIFDEV